MLLPRLLSAVACVCLIAGMCPIVCGQDDEATFRTDVRVVNVLANVRDKKGSFVRDLSKEDFTLLEDGRPQNIAYFSRDTDLPLTIGLMVDTSMSQHRLLDAERGASYRFLDHMLRDQDQVFIMQFDMAVLLSQDLTSSRKHLEETLPLVDTPTRQELEMEGMRGGTLLYDAIVKASNDIMKKRTGRKAFIVLSDGGENGSEATIDDAVDAAQLSDTFIYSFRRSGISGRPRWPGHPEAFVEADRRRILRSLEEAEHRPDFRHDSGRAAQPIQPRVRARQAGDGFRVPQDSAHD